MTKTENQIGAQNTDWERGYFCAVAALIRMDGVVNTNAKELFAAGGNADGADEEDKCTFREHKLTIGEDHARDEIRTRIEGFEPETQDPWAT